MAYSNPKISLLVLTYNLETIVAQSLASVFEQDYDNLEIVISDDCSQDRTFNILQQLTQDYHGPHKVILHRNAQNMGICANFFQAFDLASGEWLCMASGDDICLPNRATMLMKAARDNPDARILSSQVQVIDGDGRSYIPTPAPVFWIGAALCWHRDIFQRFPRPALDRAPEDSVLLPRTFFLGKTFVQIPEVLLKYRVDGHHYTRLPGNCSRDLQQRLLCVMKENILCTRSHRQDYEYACQQGWIMPQPQVSKHMERCLQSYQTRLQQAQKRLEVLSGSVRRKLAFILRGSPEIPDGFMHRLWLVLGQARRLNQVKCWCFRKLAPAPRPASLNNLNIKRTLTLEDYADDAFQKQ